MGKFHQILYAVVIGLEGNWEFRAALVAAEGWGVKTILITEQLTCMPEFLKSTSVVSDISRYLSVQIMKWTVFLIGPRKF